MIKGLTFHAMFVDTFHKFPVNSSIWDGGWCHKSSTSAATFL